MIGKSAKLLASIVALASAVQTWTVENLQTAATLGTGHLVWQAVALSLVTVLECATVVWWVVVYRLSRTKKAEGDRAQSLTGR